MLQPLCLLLAIAVFSSYEITIPGDVTMYRGEHDGASLFSGGGFMPSQATQTTDSGFSSSKNRENQGLMPLTVKQVSDALPSSDDRSGFVIDGVDVGNITLVGMVADKMEKVTNVTFILDDGTGRIEINKWVNDLLDSDEVTKLQNGTYVCVHGQMKSLQGKKHVSAFSVRPVTNFDQVAHHFIECIYVHQYYKKKNKASSQLQSNSTVTSQYQNDALHPQSLNTNLFSHPGMDESESAINRKVLAVFLEPQSLAADCGIHINKVAERLRLPMDQIMASINYHVNMGNIYSTIDDFHFRSTSNG